MRTVSPRGTRVTYCSISPNRRMRGLLGELIMRTGICAVRLYTLGKRNEDWGVYKDRTYVEPKYVRWREAISSGTATGIMHVD